MAKAEMPDLAPAGVKYTRFFEGEKKGHHKIHAERPGYCVRCMREGAELKIDCPGYQTAGDYSVRKPTVKKGRK